MKKKFFFVTLNFMFIQLYSQGNCQWFLSEKDTLKYRACILITENQDRYYQFDTRYHNLMSKAIEICPYYAYPYRELSASYVKSGNFLKWKELIDKAVKYEPEVYLAVRASLRYKFFADYKGAIQDIDSLTMITSQDIGYTSNGTYHLNIVKGLCLKALGKIDEAIQIIEKQSKIDKDFSMFNHLHLGVLYMQKKHYNKALLNFEMQVEINNIAENQYYIGLCYKNLNQDKKALHHLKEAVKLYKSGLKMFDAYNQLFDQIYLTDINKEIDLIPKIRKIVSNTPFRVYF